MNLFLAERNMQSKKRPYFSCSSNDIISYYVYQPVCLLLEPFVTNNGIIPNEITATRSFADVAAAAAIVTSAIDGDSPRRWLWLLVALLCVMYIGMSDDLDGYIARKYNLTSVWGGYADGIADIGGWILTWLAMFYAFGFRRVILPLFAWCLLGAYGFCPGISERSGKNKVKVKSFLVLNTNVFPLFVALLYACYPLR